MAATELDRGYAWVILASCFICMLIHGGIIFSMTLMYQALLERFGMDASDTGSPGALLGTVMLASSPFVGYMCRALGVRMVVMIGGCLYGGGLLMAAFSVHPMMVTVGYGAITGFAANMFVFSSYLIMNEYFLKKRSIAHGLVMCGNSIGGMLFPPFFEYCLENYGFTGAVALQAGILLNYIPMGMLLRPLLRTTNLQDTQQHEDITHNKLDEIDTNHGSQTSVASIVLNTKEISNDTNGIISTKSNTLVHNNNDSVANPDIEIPQNKDTMSIVEKVQRFLKDFGVHHLKSPVFVTYVLVICSLMNSFFSTGIYMSGVAKEKCGLSNSQIALMLTIAACTDIFAELVLGLVMDTALVRRFRPFVFAGIYIVKASVGVLIAASVSDFVTMTIAWTVFFICNSVCFAQSLVLLADIYMGKDFGSALGLARFIEGLMIYPGIRIAGTLVDSLGSYAYVFYYCSVVDALCILTFLIAFIISQQRKTKSVS